MANASLSNWKYLFSAGCDQQEQSFQEVKQLLSSPNLLVHFDDQKPIVLACDASPFGVGAVLSHILEDGTEHPVAYASHSLSHSQALSRCNNWFRQKLGIVVHKP